MPDIFTRLRFPAALLLCGFVLLLFALFDVQDFKNFKFSLRHSIEIPGYVSIIIGISFSSASLLMFSIQEGLFPVVSISRAKKIKNGFTAKFGKANVNIIFGRLEETIDDITRGKTKQLVTLTANEYFDDE